MPRKTTACRRLRWRIASRFNEAAARCRGKRLGAAPGLVIGVASMRPRPDAAENGGGDGPRRGRAGRFNEAAARCRGKLARLAGEVADLEHASMRPRPDAAENSLAERASVGGRSASMRPRPDAAENSGAGHRGDPRRLASMRPRPDAAENGGAGRRSPVASPGFNEAAARCRGKHDSTPAPPRRGGTELQ